MGISFQQFDKLFRARARSIRLRITLRWTLTGLAAGLVVSAAASGAFWMLGHDAIRPWTAIAGAFTAILAAAIAWHKRWSDSQIALYLDGRWQTNETITTALQLQNSDRANLPTPEAASPQQADSPPVAQLESSPDSELKAQFETHAASSSLQAGEVVMTQALRTLTQGSYKLARPRIWHLNHGLIPLGATLVVLMSVLQLPAKQQSSVAPGQNQIRMETLEALKPVMALDTLPSSDPEQQKRFQQIAQDAKKLQDNLAKGMELRQIQAEVARLRDAVAAERSRISSSQQRAGLEAAYGKLAQNIKLKKAADALADRDLTRFDEQMQKQANQREQQDRQLAMQALEEAAKEAEKYGAKDVAEMLREQQRLFAQRQKRAQALRDFADAFGHQLPSDVKEKLEQFEQQGTDASAAELEEKIAEALSRLSAEERKRLAENLKKHLQNKPTNDALQPMTKEQIEQMLDQLSMPQGQRQLEQMLRQMAKAPDPSEQLQQDKSLEDAEKGLGQAERQLAQPLIIPVPSQGNNPKATAGKQSLSGAKGQTPSGNDSNQFPGGNANSAGGGDKTNHQGQTKPVQSDEFRARAGGKINPAAPMPGVAVGRAQAPTGQTANIQGEQGIGQAAPTEIGGTERSEIPQDYREQVGRYFQP